MRCVFITAHIILHGVTSLRGGLRRYSESRPCVRSALELVVEIKPIPVVRTVVVDVTGVRPALPRSVGIGRVNGNA
jgi:hypothetical protein